MNAICDALRQLLEGQDLVKYIETILTTHVCKQPPDYESGLRLLLQLQGASRFDVRLLSCTWLTLVADHAEIVEDAVKYIIFLSDVNKLYDVALGMYNFQLVLMVAQYSQKVGQLPCPANVDMGTNIGIGSQGILAIPTRAPGFGSARTTIQN